MSLNGAEANSRYPRPQRPADAEHFTIYYDPEFFSAFVFNHNFWVFPDGELLVNFVRARCSYEHRYDLKDSMTDGRGEYVTLRSTNGGRTWPLESLQVLGTHQGLERLVESGLAPDAPAEALDWTSPDFCVTAGFGAPPIRNQHLSYVQYSRDRGRTWEGPYLMPSMGFAQVYGKPDYLVRPDGLVLLFMTVGRGPVSAFYNTASLCIAVYATTDGGLTWEYLSSIHRSAPDREFVGHFYASPILLSDGRILVATRCHHHFPSEWTELFESEDGGRTWQFVSRVNDWGAPGSLLLLDDNRVVMVYGYRVEPEGIRARVSADDGRSWGPELILRDDGGSLDVGYARAVKLPGGKVMAAYYFNRSNDPMQLNGGVRHIAATVFTP